MRKREQILKDGLRPEFLILEVLLDMRDQLINPKVQGTPLPATERQGGKKRGRPGKTGGVCK